MDQLWQRILDTILENPWILGVMLAWVLPWKAIALWKAARLGQKIWFVALLLINTLGILEIIYIFAVAKGKCCGVIKREDKNPAVK